MKRILCCALLLAVSIGRVCRAQQVAPSPASSSCKTYAKVESNCSAVALSDLRKELANLGLTEAPAELADLKGIRLKCSVTKREHHFGAILVREDVSTETLSVTTRHGAQLDSPVVARDWSALHSFLSKNGRAVQIVPEASAAYSILAPEVDKSDLMSEPRTIRCLPMDAKVTVKRGTFEFSDAGGSASLSVLKVQPNRKLFYQLRYPREPKWPEPSVIAGCIGLRAEDCKLSLSTNDRELRGEFLSATESPLASLQTVPASTLAQPGPLTVQAGVPWTYEWSVPSSFSKTLELRLQVDHEQVAKLIVSVDVPFWAALATALPEKWQIILRDSPNVFGVVLIAVLVLGTAAFAWLRGRNWAALLKRLLGKPPA